MRRRRTRQFRTQIHVPIISQEWRPSDEPSCATSATPGKTVAATAVLVADEGLVVRNIDLRQYYCADPLGKCGAPSRMLLEFAVHVPRLKRFRRFQNRTMLERIET